MKSWHEYYRDTNKITIFIKYNVKLPSKVEDFNIDDDPLYVKQDSGELHVTYKKIITQTLFEDIKEFFDCFKDKKPIRDELLKKNPSQYIIGYLKHTIIRINKEILQRKYKEGHILLKTISQFDIYNVFISNKPGEFYPILWPLSLPIFPEVKKYQQNEATIFIKDMIDAMTEYFNFNLDECIRKIITSLENYFSHYNLKTKKSFLSKMFSKKQSKVKNLINKYVNEEYYHYKERDLKILRENILYIYSKRNEIVHDKLRINLDNQFFCKKAIGTLLYIYQSKFIINNDKFNFIFSFYSQFLMINDIIMGMDLDYLEEKEKTEKNKKTKMIKDKDDIDKLMFEGLIISKSEKKKLNKK